MVFKRMFISEGSMVVLDMLRFGNSGGVAPHFPYLVRHPTGEWAEKGTLMWGLNLERLFHSYSDRDPRRPHRWKVASSERPNALSRDTQRVDGS